MLATISIILHLCLKEKCNKKVVHLNSTFFFKMEIYLQIENKMKIETEALFLSCFQGFQPSPLI